MAIDWLSPNPVRGRVAAAARVVVVKASGRVEPEESSKVRELGIDRAPETLLDRGAHRPGESGPIQHGEELVVEARRKPGGERARREQQRNRARQSILQERSDVSHVHLPRARSGTRRQMAKPVPGLRPSFAPQSAESAEIFLLPEIRPRESVFSP